VLADSPLTCIRCARAAFDASNAFGRPITVRVMKDAGVGAPTIENALGVLRMVLADALSDNRLSAILATVLRHLSANLSRARTSHMSKWRLLRRPWMTTLS
jgi:hypothetical protein